MCNRTQNNYIEYCPAIMFVALLLTPAGPSWNEKRPLQDGLFEFNSLVAGPGVGPGLEDYEPSVQPYTTPRVAYYTSNLKFLKTSKTALFNYFRNRSRFGIAGT